MLRCMDVVDPENMIVCHAALAWCVLHNICMRDDYTDYACVVEENDERSPTQPLAGSATDAGKRRRQSLVDHMLAQPKYTKEKDPSGALCLRSKRTSICRSVVSALSLFAFKTALRASIFPQSRPGD